MQISNHNLSAVVANNRLKTSENMVTQAMERLSTGLSINKSKDHPAHMAQTNKLETNINGMNEARKNADNTSSMLQTMDGVLSQINAMLQRIRELSVEAATDTMTESDRDHIQDEIEELLSEVDRMCNDTEFNRKALLNGNFDNKVFPSKNTKVDAGGDDVFVPDAENIYVSDDVMVGTYDMVVEPGTKSKMEGNSACQFADPAEQSTTVKEDEAGSIKINGYTIVIEAGESYFEVCEKLQHGFERGDAEITLTDNPVTVKASRFGPCPLDIEVSNNKLENLLGLPGAFEVGKDAKASDLYYTDSKGNRNMLRDADFSTEGNSVRIRRSNGFELDFDLHPDNKSSKLSLEITDMGSYQAQIGAEDGANVKLRVPRCDTKMMHIDDINVCTVNGADRGIVQVDDALKYVSKIRSMIGAYDNRMEAVSDTLRQKNENLTNSVSKLRDTDMAAEMTNYTTANILVQAGTSVLSQCNDQPEMVLQILQ